MAQPYLGEIRIFAGNFEPAGWAFCDGQPIAISENEPLFTLIGTTYGGDGQSTFQLPDLRGRLPIHFGNGFELAASGGVEEVTLSVSQIPSHTHPFMVSTAPGTQSSPGNSLPGSSASLDLYVEDNATVNMSPNASTAVGGGQRHTNFQPYLCVNFIISLFGIFPSPT